MAVDTSPRRANPLAEMSGTVRAWFKPGELVLAAVVAAPLALSWSRLTARFGQDLGDSLLDAARAAGILGLALVLVAGALSVRLPHLDVLFGGLPRLWKVHHMLAFFGLLLVIAHVWLQALSALTIARDLPVRLLFPALTSEDVWIGWLALVAFVVFLAPSFKFFGHPHYQRWKLLHMIAAPTALALAFIHGVLIAPDTTVWWLIGGLAAASVLWRRVGSKLLVRFPYSVEVVEKLAADVVEISLRPQGRRLSFEPGQFVYLTPTDPSLKAGRQEEHPYSVSSAPQEEVLRVGIKDLGDASHAIQQVSVGSRVWIEGPYGTFFARHFRGRGQLWLGGGIGITPIVAGVRMLQARGQAPAGGVHVFYLADSVERAYYRNVLLSAAASTPGLQVTEHYFSREGPLNAAFLSSHCPDFGEREVYICGPPPMLSHLRGLLRSLGVPGARVHSEEFTFL